MRVVCMRCGRERAGDELRCPRCGGPFTVIVDFQYREKVRENFPYIRRWVSLGEGNTPLVEVEGVKFKLEFLNPTGSFKDRGSAVLISALAERGVKRISEDSSGNAGASIAAYGALAGMDVEIYVPETARGGKLRQIEAYGARVVRVPGSRDDVAKSAERSGAYYASHVWRPEFRDGIRTLAYELVRDLGKAPAEVYLPTSAGTLLLGVYAGFKHLLDSGVVDRMPTLVAVQTEQVRPLCAAVRGEEYEPPGKVTSIADALVSTNPPLLPEMAEAVRTHGDCVWVTDGEIERAWRWLARRGLLAEPSSAAALAGYWKRGGGEDSVVVLTGSGLKAL
ncbi:MAG: pyridoxal-phosphate dependent enzyme [Thermoproteus sp.]|jgi:threonine synthase|nr:pyridoxal-phosphate dependent enzyme [Thermoproteus sp.]MDT7883087.1 pyridoxal-phosphate dependent enzyme [Thermoproteus sp.]